MKIYVELMSFIRRPDNVPRTFEHELDESTTISQLLKNLGYTSDEIRMMQTFVSTVTEKDNVRAQRSYVLKDGDHLFITLPVGGG